MRSSLTLAGDIMLRWKQLQGDEQASLARPVLTAGGPKIKEIVQEEAALRAGLARLAQEEHPTENPNAMFAELESKEPSLARASSNQNRHMKVCRADDPAVRSPCRPADSCLTNHDMQS